MPNLLEAIFLEGKEGAWGEAERWPLGDERRERQQLWREILVDHDAVG